MSRGGVALLQASRVSKRFGGVDALRDVGLAVMSGEVVALVGPNGAGKTTLFNILSGFLQADSGTVEFQGTNVSGAAPYTIARLGLGRTFQDLRLFRRLSVLENIVAAVPCQTRESLLGGLLGWGSDNDAATRARELIQWVGLAEKVTNPAETLSYGEQKLLAIAACLALEPQLILLDEPVAGVQQDMALRITSLMGSLRSQDKAVLFIEHDLELVARVADRVIVLANGKKIAEGPPEAIREDHNVREALLS